MRLFVALNFSEEVKNKIEDITLRVKEHSTQGKFVNKGLMHLTVEFLGEISENNIELIKEAIDSLESEHFRMVLTNIGYFQRREGDICWIGIEENAKLLNIQSQLHEKLLKMSFKLEDREYKPHLTIGRKVKMMDDFNPDLLSEEIREIKIDIESIELMKSEQKDGKLTYTSIYSKSL